MSKRHREMMIGKFNSRFPNLQYTKLVLFRNPNEFNHMFIERINPNHRGVVWGRRRKDLKKGTNYIRVGEIYFSVLLLTLSLSHVAWVDAVTGYAYSLLMQTSIVSLCTCFILSVMLYYMPFKLREKSKCLTYTNFRQSSYI